DMGVDGFREDVINFISKREGLPNGLPFLPAVNGMPHYKDGPHIHEYMAEFRKVCEEYDCFQIGEGPMTTVNSALKYLTGPTKSLDMMFSFDHMMADCFYTEYMHRPFSLVKLKKAFSKWQYALSGKAWNALYLENHDHPRIISRYGSERYWRESGTMLATSFLFQQGTPFIYQGQEIGMTNIRLTSIEQYVDVSSKNNYHTYHLKDTVEERLRRIHISSRDSARTPMQWDTSVHAGFSEAKPWFYVNENYHKINVADEEKNPNSILNFYRKCLALRKESDTLLDGTYREYFPKAKHIYVYERALGKERFLIICSFTHFEEKFTFPAGYEEKNKELVLCNYENPKEECALRPYEARVYRFKEF
nr:glucohydrolase [Acetatifactor sp.]